MASQTYPKPAPTSASAMETRPTYGRIRLDELASQELLWLLRREIDTIVRSDDPRPDRSTRSRKRRIERMLAELHRMRQELGWEPPLADRPLSADR